MLMSLQLPDAEWRQRLKIIQQNHASLTGDVSGAGGFRIARGENNGRRSMIPDVHTFHASEVSKFARLEYIGNKLTISKRQQRRSKKSTVLPSWWSL